MADEWLADLPPLPPPRGKAVRETAELRRIRDTPVRDWEQSPQLAPLVEALTSRLRTGVTIPSSLEDMPRQLLPAQAVALLDLVQLNGVFVPLVTGGGKTLLTLLAMEALDIELAVLLLPKRMLRKTVRAAKELAPFWRVPDVLEHEDKRTVLRSDVKRVLHLVQYELLPHRPALLTDRPYQLLMADECHYLKKRRAARTRIVKAARKKHRDIPFMCLSGSVMARTPMDFAHSMFWCLGLSSPWPNDWTEGEDWAYALAQDVDECDRLQPGALLQLGDAEGETPLETARKRFAQRLTRTRGVVSAVNDLPPCGLIIKVTELEPSLQMKQWLRDLKTKHELPNGTPCESGLELHAKERQCGAGFWYQYVEQPPADWLDAKRLWAWFCTATLERSQKLFSPMDVANAVDAGRLIDSMLHPLTRERVDNILGTWRRLRGTFTPQTEAVWHDYSTVDYAAKWLAEEQGLCWVSHVEFGQKLSERTGVPYFRELAMCGQVYLEDHSGPAIVSVHSCNEGLNLQHKWHSNLVVTPPTGEVFEQLLSRTHRRGQKQDDVTCEVLLRVEADKSAWHRALADAKCVTHSMMQRKRLTVATFVEE